jgi:hypothetical protein
MTDGYRIGSSNGRSPGSALACAVYPRQGLRDDIVGNIDDHRERDRLIRSGQR